MAGALPALLSLALAAALGGFASATGAVAVVATPLLLVGMAGFAAGETSDPLRLGRGVGWLPWLVVAGAAASWLHSPVPRAGRVALGLAPALVLLPVACARSLSTASRRRVAAGSWAVTVLVVASWALWASARAGWARAAEPLGHHSLLGAWLVMTVPLAAAALAERGWPRRVGAVAVVVGAVALVSTRSLAALAAAVVISLLALPRLGRARNLVAGLALLALAASVPRIAAITEGRDSSAEARLVYARAALEGFAEHPLAGWGPGVLPWTLAAFVHPLPGINPPGELVGEPHSTPLRLLYELGAPNFAAILALVLLLCWKGIRVGGEKPALVRGGELGAAAGALAALGASWLAVPALPVTLACALGCSMAGRTKTVALRPRLAALAGALVLGVGAAAIAQPVAAAFEYARALRSETRAQLIERLERASSLDPTFPLYRARLAWNREQDVRRQAIAALVAARDGRGVAPLWLRGGAMALEAGDSGPAHRAFERALALDPLGAEAPFLMFVASQGREIDCAARAMLAEPRLAAAAIWRTHPNEWRAAIRRVLDWAGVNRGWRESFVAQASGVRLDDREQVDLVASIDETPALSASLHLFRRPPSPQDLTRIRLLRDQAARMTVPPAVSLPISSAAAFPPTACAPQDYTSVEPPSR